MHGDFPLPLQVGLISDENCATRQHHLVLLEIQENPLGRLKGLTVHHRVNNHKQVDAVCGAERFNLRDEYDNTAYANTRCKQRISKSNETNSPRDDVFVNCSSDDTKANIGL